MEEAEDVEPVADRDDDDVVEPGERRPVEPVGCGTAVEPGAAMDPDQHRPVAAVACGRPDVESEAVLVHRQIHPTLHGLEAGRDLRADGSERGGLADPRPRPDGLRWAEAEGPDGRLGVAHAPKHPHITGSFPAESTASDVDDDIPFRHPRPPSRLRRR